MNLRLVDMNINIIVHIMKSDCVVTILWFAQRNWIQNNHLPVVYLYFLEIISFFICRKSLCETAERLADKYEDAKYRQDAIMKRYHLQQHTKNRTKTTF